MTERAYTTQLGAGLGMVSETIELLRFWEPGMTRSELAAKAVESGAFARTTARRTRNLAVEIFAPRFMGRSGEVASRLGETGSGKTGVLRGVVEEFGTSTAPPPRRR